MRIWKRTLSADVLPPKPIGSCNSTDHDDVATGHPVGPQAAEAFRRATPKGGQEARHCVRLGGVLFDEPLSNLVAKLRVQIRLEIRRLQEILGITALYVTHHQVEAMTMADRMVVMNGCVAEHLQADDQGLTEAPIKISEPLGANTLLHDQKTGRLTPPPAV